MLKNPDLWLRKGADRRLRQGHHWVYSNEVATDRSPLKGFLAGDLVSIRTAGGDVLGTAYMEPDSLICARLLSPLGDSAPDVSYFRERFKAAQKLREQFYPQPYYRLVYGDSDGLSGLVIDRYGPYLVVQLNTAGMERMQSAIVDALVGELSPAGVLLRSDSRARREQGLAESAEVVHGDVPDQVELVENDVRFLAPVRTGQKTGWFYDHRENRALLRDRVEGKRVLDVYSYIGGWGVQTAVFGAADVVCVDSSAAALDQVADNARLNGVESKLTTAQGQATDVMAKMHDAAERFDVVILDPPAFIQRKRDLAKGRKAYRRINELGMRLLEEGGLLVAGSCSMHLSHEDLREAVQSAAVRSNVQMRQVARGYQAPDHPVHPAIPETEYLKALYFSGNRSG